MAGNISTRRIFKIVHNSALDPQLWIIEKVGDPDYLCRVVKFDSDALADMAGDIVEQARHNPDRTDHLLTAAADLGAEDQAKLLADKDHAVEFLSEDDDEALVWHARRLLAQLDEMDPNAPAV